MNTCSTKAKIAARAVTFTAFLGVFYGGVGTLCKQTTASANTRAVVKKGRKKGKKKRWWVIFVKLFFILFTKKVCGMNQACVLAFGFNFTGRSLNG